MVFRKGWRRLKVALTRLPARKPERSPACYYRDLALGDPEQGMRLVAGQFRYGGQLWQMPDPAMPGSWERAWPEEVTRWLYGFGWLRDLRALGTNEARLTARALVCAWLAASWQDSRLLAMAQEAGIMGERLSNWLGHYEFCLLTAVEETQAAVMEAMVREGRLLAALLPLEPQGWQGLAALRGLLAAFMAQPEHKGFFQRFQRYLERELKRVFQADGTVAERSPEAQFQAVRELVSFLLMFNALQLAPPPAIVSLLARACAVLRALCHGDGALALFNGSQERASAEVEALLARAERYHVITPTLPQGGFVRLTLGRALLLVDGAPPPVSGHDRHAHAGTLSFEFSWGGQRLLVNCGSAGSAGLRQALRASPAHNVLVAEGESSSEFGPGGGIIRRPAHVTCAHRSTADAHWLDLSHDGYHPSYGAIWKRHLYLGGEGGDLRGREVVEGERDLNFVVRFHVHPDVKVIQEDQDIILQAPESIWRFCQSGGALRVEQDLYAGRGSPEASTQIVIRSRPGRSFDVQDGPARRRQRISWKLERLPE
ncbi:heparinase II/III family protein [Oecophyllibacter saccharovorans]|uniref:heparinase II/III family protein n=1 Tax=Oecophyllibacter saccharovorans TaxID=2558360 RepID=UPI001168D156|nr:heparinase II/III family protein [Oecophyllibacter saccharovorans]TPW36255.1 heparinase [Oecophyllibacter saccharovorans]